MVDQRQSFELALTVTRAGNLFTTHTSVEAGFDRFAPDVMARYLGSYAAQDLSIAFDDLLSLGLGIWIDHKSAVIVCASEGLVTTQALESEVEPHPHYSSQQDSGGKKKYEERRGQHLDQDDDEVISQLGPPMTSHNDRHLWTVRTCSSRRELLSP